MQWERTWLVQRMKRIRTDKKEERKGHKKILSLRWKDR